MLRNGWALGWPHKSQRLHFWAKSSVTKNGCFIWKARIDKGGYGRLTWKGQTGVLAHRLAYKLMHESLTDKVPLDHLCHQKRCINPLHLEAVTIAENNRRALRPNRRGVNQYLYRTHCKNGHPFDQANTYFDKKQTARRCRICSAINAARYRKRQALQAGRETHA